MKYISLLRGINVGGRKKIIMSDLKSLYEKAGYKNVVTYIQSGNVLFDSDNVSREALELEIFRFIETEYGFHIPVIIRTGREMKESLENCPFDEAGRPANGSRVLLAFLQSAPVPQKMKNLQNYVKLPERLISAKTEVYLHCPEGYGESRLTASLIEKKLGVPATVRNWRTVKKLYELSLIQGVL